MCQGNVGGKPRFPGASRVRRKYARGRSSGASSQARRTYRLPAYAPPLCGGPARLDPSLELNQGDPPCSSPPWPPGPRQGWAACSDRFWLLELRVSQHFSTFYEPSVQTMDAQLNALATLAVRARTVSGCLNSAFLRLERNRSAVGKTKAPLVAGGPQQLTPPTPQIFNETTRG